jgi:hypothetical protein
VVCIASCAFFLFIAIIILQVRGVAAASCAPKTNPIPPVRWYSPLFQPVGIAVRDGNCNVYEIDQKYTKGISCSSLPSVQQNGWLKGTL